MVEEKLWAKWVLLGSGREHLRSKEYCFDRSWFWTAMARAHNHVFLSDVQSQGYRGSDRTRVIPGDVPNRAGGASISASRVTTGPLGTCG